MGDALFPIPEPTFIYVHDVYLIPITVLTSRTDERGKVYTNLPPIEEVMVPEFKVRGYLTAPDERKDQTGYIKRQEISAVCALPSSAQVDYDTHVLLCVDPQVPTHLRGIFDIDTVRQTIVHQRAMLRRHRKQWEKY